MGLPAVAGRLEPIDPEDLADLSSEERRAEAWYLRATGMSVTAIAARFEVSRQAVTRWMEVEARRRRTHAENVEAETERIIGVLEAVVNESWARSRDAGPNSMAGPSHIKNVLEAAKEIARLRGLEPIKRTESGTRTTEVVVRIGGGRDLPAVDVGIREVESA